MHWIRGRALFVLSVWQTHRRCCSQMLPQWQHQHHHRQHVIVHVLHIAGVLLQILLPPLSLHWLCHLRLRFRTLSLVGLLVIIGAQYSLGFVRASWWRKDVIWKISSNLWDALSGRPRSSSDIFLACVHGRLRGFVEWSRGCLGTTAKQTIISKNPGTIAA